MTTRFNKKFFLRYTAVILLLIFLYLIGILQPVNNLVIKFFNPISQNLYQFGSKIRTFINKQTDKRDTDIIIRELEVQVYNLIQENARYKTIEQENNTLREFLGFLEKGKYQYQMANIISRGDFFDLANKTQSLIIDQGKNNGLTEGLAVMNSQGIIIGKLAEVQDNIAKVYLTTNPKCRLAATIMGQNKGSSVVEGESGLTIVMKFIPQEVEVKTNDLVITSGLEKDIPRGLVIGRVIDVDKASNELWQTASIMPIANVEEVLIVAILKK